MGNRDYSEVLSYSHLGVMFLVTVGGAIFLGLKADEWLGTTPLWTLLGLGVGFAVGFYYLFVTLFKSEKKDEDTPSKDGQADGSDERQGD